MFNTKQRWWKFERGSNILKNGSLLADPAYNSKHTHHLGFQNIFSFFLQPWCHRMIKSIFGEITNPDLDRVQMSQLPPPCPASLPPMFPRGRVTKQPGDETTAPGGWSGGGGGVCAGGRQDLGMIVWSYLQWGTPDRGIRTVASDKEAINILEAQDGTLLGRI